jgi:hypothetical protein
MIFVAFQHTFKKLTFRNQVRYHEACKSVSFTLNYSLTHPQIDTFIFPLILLSFSEVISHRIS